jgi:dienelactone hydrolase
MAKQGDLTGEDARIRVYDGEIPGYEAIPSGPGPFPIVVIAPEIFGVNENIRAICRRFAQDGYYAVAPDLFIRQGDVSKMTDHQEMVKVVSQVPDAQAITDLEAAAEHAGRGMGDIRRLFMTGFCWGGRIAWLYAAESPRLRAAVAWYGRLEGDSDELHQRTPIEVADRTATFRSRAWSECASSWRSCRRTRISTFIRKPATDSSPISARATMKPRPPTVGGGCSSGSAA